MRIEKLSLRNFRSHESTDLTLDRLSVIRGINGSGKSTIALALELLLTGKNAVTDLGGRGADQLIRLGATAFSVEAEIKVGKETVPLRTTRNGSSGTLVVGNFAAGRTATNWIETHIAPIPVLSAVLNSGAFLEMKPAEQKALLADALGGQPVAIPPEVLEWMKALDYRAMAPVAVKCAADVDTLYQTFYDLRTIGNREMKSLGGLRAPEKPKDIRTLADVRAQIAQLESDQRKKVQARANLLADHNAAVTGRQAAEAQKAQHESHLLSDGDVEKLRKVVQSGVKAQELDKVIADQQETLNALRRRLAELEEAATSCPTCKRQYDDVDLKNRDKTVGDIRTATDQAQVALEKSQTARLKLGDPAQAELKIAAHKNAVIALAHAEEALKRTVGDKPDTFEIDAEIEQLEARLKRGREVEAEVIGYEAAVHQYRQVSERQTTLQQRVNAIERLVEYFGPTGTLMARLVGDRLAGFRDRLNEVLGRFGFGCQFDLEPYRLQVGCCDRDGWLSLSQLSESEAYRFGIAFAVALAEATGVGMVLIDRADVLTADARHLLSGLLMESALEQAVILCTGEPTVNVPSIPDVGFYNLTNVDGRTQVERVGAAEAVTV